MQRAELQQGNTLLPGQPTPLGAHCVQTPNGPGVNFAIWSATAGRVELCVFENGQERRYPLPARSNGVWYGFLPGAAAGLLYGYRLHGDYDPKRGKRFNPHKLLLDPYARQLLGEFKDDDRLLDYQLSSVSEASGPGPPAWQPSSADNADCMPRCVVVEDHFDWQGAVAPGTALADTIVYELHVKGYTRLHPDVPKERQGTYLGLAEPVIIDHFKRLGITAIELLPCASFVSEHFLTQRGLSNYWGYNAISFFAPHAGYADKNPVAEFQTMVRAMHLAGIEVIVDVVYNHTAEGDARGPSLSFRGIDNTTYYQLNPHDRSSYINNSGCGNSLAVDQPVVLKLVLDSLRYWVEVLHVDGFRFDLGPSLARVNNEFDSHAAFLQAIYQDPVLSRVKLLAEPWDVGHAGYRLGQFPPGWSEWNDQYRSTVRSFWRGDTGVIPTLASRQSGSSDIFGQRGPLASVNYVTSHDGYTLADLVSYTRRHNEANGEQNADGDRNNHSWNHGVEGPTSDAQVLLLRERDKRALLATLLLSQGVPMLLGGDELGRTQQGNNNAYCQDNAISWVDWSTADQSQIEFVTELVALRKKHGVFRRRHHLAGALDDSGSLHDVEWLTASGIAMQSAHWQDPQRRVLAVLLHAMADATIDMQPGVDDDDVLILINGSDESLNFTFPVHTGPWICRLTTHPASSNELAAQSPAAMAIETNAETDHYVAMARSLVVLTCSH